MDIDVLFQDLYPALYRYLHRLTGDADEAEDVAQESFVRLLRQSLPEEEARPWLFTVATNLVRDRARKRQRHLRLSDSVPGPTREERPDVSAERADRIQRVRAALAEVPERDRMLLMMREEGFKYDEIARIIGVAPGSVGTLLSRALRRFADVYREQNEVEDVDDAR
ncbi:MAG TPA: sigma-70 family RNA polymerase sigma factor [Longimicrobiales bacterium]|nr:sigma-70 family RNA polymerase sigma factor [Longimicrobiales bacterium]